MSSNTNDNPRVTIADILNKFKFFHEMYFHKLPYILDVRSLIVIIDSSSNDNYFALADLLKPPQDATEDRASLDELNRLLHEFVTHVCGGFMALLADHLKTDPNLGEMLPTFNFDINSYCSAFRNDIEGVRLLVYNIIVVAALYGKQKILFSLDDINILTETICVIETVEHYRPDFFANVNFPPDLPIPPSFLEQLYKAFDAVEVLDFSADFKALIDQIPRRFILHSLIWKRCIRVIKVLTPSSKEDPQTEALVDLMEALFSRVFLPNEILQAYWESCHEGPLAFSRFCIYKSLRELEISKSNYDQSMEGPSEISQMVSLAWLLIGDTRAAFTWLVKELVHSDFFFQMTVRWLPIIYSFVTPSGDNLFLSVMAKVVADIRTNVKTVEKASPFLVKLSQNFGDSNLGLIPATILLDFAVKQIFESERPAPFWLRVASNLVAGAVYPPQSIVIEWDATSKLPHNPFVLALLMLKISATKKIVGVDMAVVNIKSALCKLLDTTPALKDGWQALDDLRDVHCTFIFLVIQWLELRNCHYKPRIPAVLYDVLDEEEKAKFRELRHPNLSLSLGDFLACVFEIGLIGSDIPNTFLNGAATKYTEAKDNDVLALALLKALKRIRNIGVEEFKPSMFEFINKVATNLKFKFFVPLIDGLTPATFKDLYNFQPIRVLVLAVRITIEKHPKLLIEEKVNIADLSPEAQLLFSTYCTASRQRGNDLKYAYERIDYQNRYTPFSQWKVKALSAYAHAVSVLFNDSVTLAILLDPLPDEFVSMLQQLQKIHSSAEKKMDGTYDVIIGGTEQWKKPAVTSSGPTSSKDSQATASVSGTFKRDAYCRVFYRDNYVGRGGLINCYDYDYYGD